MQQGNPPAGSDLALLYAWPVAAALWHAPSHTLRANKAWDALFDHDALPKLKQLLADQPANFSAEACLQKKDGAKEWFVFTQAPYACGDLADQTILTAQSIEAGRQRERGLRATLSLTQTLFDKVKEAWVLVDPSGACEAMNAQARLILSDTAVKDWHAALSPAMAAARAGERVEFLTQIPHLPDGIPKLYHNEMRPFANEGVAQGFLLWSLKDVTVEHATAHALQEAQQSEKVLALELHHRVRNLFTVINGLVRISQKALQNGQEGKTCLSELRQRILVMARASELLSASDDKEKPLINPDPSAISAAVLEPFTGLYRIEGKGPEVSTSMFTTIVLVLHEMTANSLEYGVLRRKSGVIDLNWRDEGSHSRLIWREKGLGRELSHSIANRDLLHNVLALSASEMSVDGQEDGLRAEFRFRNDWQS